MLSRLLIQCAESGYVPDSILRFGIRALVRGRQRELAKAKSHTHSNPTRELVEAMRKSVVADSPQKANEQHYELPSEFFIYALGQHLKYSCGFWEHPSTTLDDSELAALKITCERARLDNGKAILELGCGWGSLTLYMAAQYPESTITAVSNSASQADYIRAQARKRSLSNITVITADMNTFKTDQTFDRIVSVEMFEHMRNWQELFARVATWLKPNGSFFMHVFAHRDTPYFFEDRGPGDWMSRTFFTGGLMPSLQLPQQFNDHLMVKDHWQWQGTHYEKTSNAWLHKMDQNKEILMPMFVNTYGRDKARTWWVRWRLFYMACAELFGYNNGTEWLVGHYRLVHREHLK